MGLEIRKYRISGIALFDLILAFLGIIILKMLNININDEYYTLNLLFN